MILEDTLTTVVTELTGAFPFVPTIKKYPKVGGQITLPAVLLEIGDFDDFDDNGDNQLELTTRFEARVIVDPVQTGADEFVRILAAQVAARIQTMNRPGPDVSNLTIADISEDMFKPELEGYLVWLVEFSATVTVGEAFWQEAGIQPTTVYLGKSPDVGTEYEDDYVEVAA